MANLSFQIQELINKVKVLKGKAPNDETLIQQYDQLETKQEDIQDKEWNDNFQGYLDAKAAFKDATDEVQKQLDALKNVEKTVGKVATVTAKLAKVITVLVKLV